MAKRADVTGKNAAMRMIGTVTMQSEQVAFQGMMGSWRNRRPIEKSFAIGAKAADGTRSIDGFALSNGVCSFTHGKVSRKRRWNRRQQFQWEEDAIGGYINKYSGNYWQRKLKNGSIMDMMSGKVCTVAAELGAPQKKNC